MKNHCEVGYFRNRLMIGLLSLSVLLVMADQSFAAMTCSSCHGMPPLDSAERSPSSGSFKGSHQVHVTAGALAADCVVCHSVASASYQMKHSADSANKINMTAGIYSKGTFFNQTSIPVLGSCSNVSCHANVYSVGTSTSPVWVATGNGCSTCHSTPIGINGPETGSHTITAHSVACTECHASGTTSTSYPTLANGHTDGDIDVINVGYPANKTKGSAATACSSASCHPNVYGTGSAVTPVWGTTNNNCSACHSVSIGANGPLTGNHFAHAGIACTACHAAGTTSTSAPSNLNGHVDGNIDIFYVGYQLDVPKHAAGTYTANCNTAYCHSNGASIPTYTPVNWGASNSVGCRFCHPTLSVGHDPHLADLFDAGTPITFYNYTTTASVGGDYKFGCSNCHPTTISSHMNNVVEVELTSSVDGGHLKLKNVLGATMNGSKQCFNVYCHSNGYSVSAQYATTPVWGGSFLGDKCASCHGNSPNIGIAGSAAHSAHTVGIHSTEIFNGVSRKLPEGGGNLVNAAHGRNNRSTTINCNICHAATITTFANDQNSACSGCHNGATAPFMNPASRMGNAANHVNGNVDVAFINQKIATKAQVAGPAFAAYTAKASGWSRNSNGMPFKTYTSSYDYTKSTLAAAASPYTTAAGCLNIACHSSIPVKWTDTISCNNCHTRLK